VGEADPLWEISSTFVADKTGPGLSQLVAVPLEQGS
jgi:hypothetical protein